MADRAPERVLELSRHRRLWESLIMRSLMHRLVTDESGGEVIDYVLVLGLVVLAAISLMGTLGIRIVAKWNSICELL
jgi:Flp pilus assembly pilin Flp